MLVSILSAHPLILERLRLQLSPPTYRVHAYLMTARELRLPVPGSADAYIIDVHEPALMQALLDTLPRPLPGLLAVDQSFERGFALYLLLMGMRGFVRYDRIEAEIIPALCAVRQGAFWAPGQPLQACVDHLLVRWPLPAAAASVPPTQLSQREREVLQGIRDRLSNKEIATRLGITERTVKFHVSNLLHHFGAATRRQLPA